MKWFWWYSLVVLAILVAGKVYLHPGMPYTHDGENHLARFANYKIAFKEGQIPPRFAPNLQNRFGYPVFNYNYPLANLLSLPFSALKIEYEVTFKLLAVLALAILAISTQEWLRLLGVGRLGQLTGVLTVASSPVVLNMTYFRGNIGELWGIALTTMALWLVERQLQHRVHWLLLTLALAALFLAHNLTAVFALPLLLGYGCLRAWQLRRLATIGGVLGKPILLAIGLSLWFWLPAVAEKSLIVLDQAGSINEYAKHFATWQQLLWTPLQFGFSYPGSIDSMSFAGGLATIAAIGVSGVYVLAGWWWRLSRQTQQPLWAKIPVWLAPLWFGVVCLLWLQTTQSAGLWSVLTPLHYAQFPWRFGLFALLASVPLLGYGVEKSQFMGKLAIGLGLAIQLVVAWQLHPLEYFHRANWEYEVFPQTTSTQHENKAKNFTYEVFADPEPALRVLSGVGQAQITTWKGSYRTYQLAAQTPVTVAEPTMLFAGWQTTANGTKLEYVDSASIGGRLAYELPPGEYQIHSRFTQQTWPRLVGNGVSLTTALGLGLVFLKRLQLHRSKQHA